MNSSKLMVYTIFTIYREVAGKCAQTWSAFNSREQLGWHAITIRDENIISVCALGLQVFKLQKKFKILLSSMYFISTVKPL